MVRCRRFFFVGHKDREFLGRLVRRCSTLLVAEKPHLVDEVVNVVNGTRDIHVRQLDNAIVSFVSTRRAKNTKRKGQPTIRFKPGLSNRTQTKLVYGCLN